MVGWEIKKAVEQAIDNIASCLMIKTFYPTYITTVSGYPLAEVFDVLMLFVKDGRLHLEWEIRCEQYGCSRTIKTILSLPDQIESIEGCVCGEDTEVTANNVFPVFSFSSDYRKSVIDTFHDNPKKVKKKRNTKKVFSC